MILLSKPQSDGLLIGRLDDEISHLMPALQGDYVEFLKTVYTKLANMLRS